MMFNEATNSWEKPAMARPGQQLSSVFPAAGMETGKGKWKEKFCASLCKKPKPNRGLGSVCSVLFPNSSWSKENSYVKQSLYWYSVSVEDVGSLPFSSLHMETWECCAGSSQTSITLALKPQARPG